MLFFLGSDLFAASPANSTAFIVPDLIATTFVDSLSTTLASFDSFAGALASFAKAFALTFSLLWILAARSFVMFLQKNLLSFLILVAHGSLASPRI